MSKKKSSMITYMTGSKSHTVTEESVPDPLSSKTVYFLSLHYLSYHKNVT